jgi:hypothetical protein
MEFSRQVSYRSRQVRCYVSRWEDPAEFRLLFVLQSFVAKVSAVARLLYPNCDFIVSSLFPRPLDEAVFKKRKIVPVHRVCSGQANSGPGALGTSNEGECFVAQFGNTQHKIVDGRRRGTVVSLLQCYIFQILI